MQIRLVLVSQIVMSVAVAALSTAPVHADLSYTLSMSTIGIQNMQAIMMPKISTTYYFTDNKERTDMLMTSQYMNMSTEMINDCATGNVYTVDPSLKIYKESDLTGVAPDPFGINSANPMGMRGLRGQEQKYDGTVTSNFTVTDVGPETVNGVAAHHRKIVITTTSTGTVPTTPSAPMTMDIWTDNTPKPIGCSNERAFGLTAPPTPNANGVTYKFSGDIDALKEVFKAVPVRMQFAIPSTPGRPGGGGKVTMDRTNLSTDSLSADMFTPPTGSTKVSDDDYSKQEMQSMMKRFTAPQGGGAPGN